MARYAGKKSILRQNVSFDGPVRGSPIAPGFHPVFPPHMNAVQITTDEFHSVDPRQGKGPPQRRQEPVFSHDIHTKRLGNHGRMAREDLRRDIIVAVNPMQTGI